MAERPDDVSEIHTPDFTGQRYRCMGCTRQAPTVEQIDHPPGCNTTLGYDLIIGPHQNL